MLTIEHREDETHEFKERGTDESLKDLAAFANGSGGTLFVGVRDDGVITGAPAHDAEIQRIANVITSRLGLTPCIRVTESNGHTVIAVEVEPNRGTVSYQGRYLRRVGSTNRDFTMEELARHLLERSGQTWDSLPVIGLLIRSIRRRWPTLRGWLALGCHIRYDRALGHRHYSRHCIVQGAGHARTGL